MCKCVKLKMCISENVGKWNVGLNTTFHQNMWQRITNDNKRWCRHINDITLMSTHKWYYDKINQNRKRTDNAERQSNDHKDIFSNHSLQLSIFAQGVYIIWCINMLWMILRAEGAFHPLSIDWVRSNNWSSVVWPRPKGWSGVVRGRVMDRFN